jgi:amidophosphoribosyltransferase
MGTLPNSLKPTTGWWSDSEKSMREKCGVLGVVMPPAASSEWSAMGQWLYYGLYALQHRGQESCGMAVFDHEQLRLHRDMGLVNQVFDATTLASMVGQIGVGHTRYSTTGSSDVGNAQPLVVCTNNGPLVMAHNGNLVNIDTLQATLDSAVRLADGCSDTLVMAEKIRAALADVPFPKINDLVRVLHQLLPTFEGAFSLVMAFGNCLIAARDSVGFRPLSMGKVTAGKAAGTMVVASETSALDIIGAEWQSDIAPGEFVVIAQDGTTIRERYTPEEPEKFCFF